MKHLKLFEAYIKDVVKSFDIDGYKIDFVDCTDVPGHKAIYSVQEYTESGLTLYPVCFSDVELAKDYISGVIKSGENIDNQGFLIKKMMLDLVVDTTKKDVELSDEIVDATKIHDFLDKNFNIILNAYIAITPQRYQKTINESSVRTALEKLRRECKSGDTKRCKEAISVFNDFIKDMMIFSIKDNNYKNIETWKLSYNGKKYFDLFSEFHKMIGHKYF
jgi:hypothetical protein